MGTLLNHTLLQKLPPKLAVAQPHNLAHYPHHRVAHGKAHAEGYEHYDYEVDGLFEGRIAHKAASVEQIVDVLHEPQGHLVRGYEIE